MRSNAHSKGMDTYTDNNPHHPTLVTYPDSASSHHHHHHFHRHHHHHSHREPPPQPSDRYLVNPYQYPQGQHHSAPAPSPYLILQPAQSHHESPLHRMRVLPSSTAQQIGRPPVVYPSPFMTSQPAPMQVTSAKPVLVTSAPVYTEVVDMLPHHAQAPVLPAPMAITRNPMMFRHHSSGGGRASAAITAAPPNHLAIRPNGSTAVPNGYNYVQNYQSAREEERKRQKRALNRQSAQRCRKRKRAMLDDLVTENSEFSRHAAILDAIPGTSMEFEFTTGNLTFVHGARYLGYRDSEMVDRSLYDFLTPASGKRVKRVVKQLLEDWETSVQESGGSNNDAGSNPGSESGTPGYSSSSGNGSNGYVKSSDIGEVTGSSHDSSNSSDNSGSNNGDSGSSNDDADNNSANDEANWMDANGIESNTNGLERNGGSSSPQSEEQEIEAQEKKRNLSGTSSDGTSDNGSSNGDGAGSSGNVSARSSSLDPSSKSKTTTTSSDRSGSSNDGTASRFTSSEPGSSTNNNISQLIPFTQHHRGDFTHQVSRVEFITKDNQRICGDVFGVVTLTPDSESMKSPGPECIWSVTFRSMSDGSLRDPTLPREVKVEGSSTGSSDDSMEDGDGDKVDGAHRSSQTGAPLWSNKSSDQDSSPSSEATVDSSSEGDADASEDDAMEQEGSAFQNGH